MPWVNRWKVIFVHMPKCGGTSVERVMKGKKEYVELLGRAPVLKGVAKGAGVHKRCKRAPQHYMWHEYKERLPKRWRDFTKFAICRNPYKRAVSEFYWCRVPNLGHKSGQSMVQFLRRVRRMLKKHGKNVWQIDMRLDHFLPQHYFTHKDGVSQVDIILKLENSEDLKNKIEELMPVKLKPAFSKRPALANGASRIHSLTEDEKALIREIYKDDFLIFGYEF